MLASLSPLLPPNVPRPELKRKGCVVVVFASIRADSPDFPSPPSFVDNFKEEARNDQPGKINNLELSDSSHSLDNHEQDADILCLDKEKPSSKKCRPNPFSNDNELLSDNVTPLILAGVRDKLMKMKLNHELPSESSSLGEFSADTNSGKRLDANNEMNRPRSGVMSALTFARTRPR